MILICAAMKAEAASIHKGIAKAKLSSQIEVLLTGMGLKNAEKSLRERLKSGPAPSAVISAGFAGSWSDDLRVGDWISVSHLWSEDGEAYPGNFPTAFGKPAQFCSVSKIHPIPQSVTRKFKERSPNPIAVDMETLAEAKVAGENGIPFQAFRYVSDSPSENLPQFLADFVSMDVAEGWMPKASHLVRGVYHVSKDPLSAVRLAAKGKRWMKDLENGWESNGPKILEAFETQR